MQDSSEISAVVFGQFASSKDMTSVFYKGSDSQQRDANIAMDGDERYCRVMAEHTAVRQQYVTGHACPCHALQYVTGHACLCRALRYVTGHACPCRALQYVTGHACTSCVQVYS